MQRTIAKFTTLMLLAWVLISFPAAPPAHAQAGWGQFSSVPAGTWSIEPDVTSGNAMYALGPGGLLRSADSGGTWSQCADDAHMMSLVAPARGQQGSAVVYAAGPGGLHVTGDGCKTWTSVGAQGLMPSAAHVRWLASYPNNMSVLYAGMDGLGGLYRSTDSGATWQPASKGLPANAWATALTADPQNSATVYVGVQYTTRDHSPAPIYRSTDGGLTWRSASLGIRMLPGDQLTGIAWSGASLFAATSDDGIFQSRDRGITWAVSTTPRRTGGGPTSNPPGVAIPVAVSTLIADPEGALFISTSEGLFQSLDGGRSWLAFGPADAKSRQALLAIEPGSGRLALASRGKAWSYKQPSGVVDLPAAPAHPQAQGTATPPPPAAAVTSTPTSPPTATSTATATTTNTPGPTATPTATVVLVSGPKPSDPVQPADPAISDFFKETGHNIKYGFRDYWKANGGLARFGLPLTEEFVENGVSVQYFERVRLEYHDGAVSLGRLGAELTTDFKGAGFRPIPFFVSEDINVYFGPTKHSVSGPFLDFFRATGRIEGVGYPLSESFKIDDNSEMQWFERARFEWHRELPAGKNIVFGNIGTEALQKRGWIR